jgi:hypothetical protein
MIGPAFASNLSAMWSQPGDASSSAAGALDGRGTSLIRQQQELTQPTALMLHKEDLQLHLGRALLRRMRWAGRLPPRPVRAGRAKVGAEAAFPWIEWPVRQLLNGDVIRHSLTGHRMKT